MIKKQITLKNLLFYTIIVVMLIVVMPKTVFASDTITFSDGTTYAVANSKETTGGKWYYNKNKTQFAYFDNKTNEFKTGWMQYKGKWYYFNPKTKESALGIHKIGNDFYYFTNKSGGYDSSVDWGAMVSNDFIVFWDSNKGNSTISNATIIAADSNGKLIKTSKWVSHGKWTTYFQYDKNKGFSIGMSNGLRTINNKKYYFNGFISKNELKRINGKLYYFGSDGAAVTGWRTINGKKYYFNSNNYAVTGWQNIGRKKYYFNPAGDAIVNTSKYIGGKVYRFDKNGAVIN